MCIGVVGYYFTRSAWSSSVLPVMFGIAGGEREHALTRLFHAFEYVCGEYINQPRIFDRVKAVYSDRAPAVPGII
eukprot:11585878-Karenia_brevis.AAC.1